MAHAAVAQHVHASRVGRDHAAYGRRVSRAHVHAEVPSAAPDVRLEDRQGYARSDGDFAGDLVDRLDVAQAEHRHDDLGPRRAALVAGSRGSGAAATDQPRVAALGHGSRPDLTTGSKHRRNLLDGAGPDDRRGDAVKAPGPVGLIGCAEIRVGQDVRRTDGRTKRLQRWFGESGAIGLEAHSPMMHGSPNRRRLSGLRPCVDRDLAARDRMGPGIGVWPWLLGAVRR